MSGTVPAATNNDAVTWVRWGVGIFLLIIINFVSVAYYSGANNSQIENNTKRIDRLEKVIETMATKDQVQDLREDLKDMRADIKSLLRDKK